MLSTEENTTKGSFSLTKEERDPWKVVKGEKMLGLSFEEEDDLVADRRYEERFSVFG